MPETIAAIEAGGTKFVCAIGTTAGDVLSESRFPTTSPAETIGRCVRFFEEQNGRHPAAAALGIGTFGPAGVNPGEPGYGCITTTPKPGWPNTDLLGPVRSALGGVPARFDTDVNAAALGEWKWGAAQGCDSVLYITVGTGIGGGALVGGEPLHGLVHPEMGHVRIPHDFERDPFPGACPFHGDCFEGLACGPAIESRWQTSARELPPDHPAWDLQAQYLASALVNFICTLSPQRIVLGGGVMEQRQIFPKLRALVQKDLNGYVQHHAILHDIDSYIVPPGLGNQAGIKGALALGAAAAA